VSVLAELAEAAGPSFAPYAVASPPAPRFAGAVADPTRLFVLECVLEGHLLHYGTARAFEGMDEDLRLLAGDALYALGLERLAERGDLSAVAELAGLISRSAQAHAEGRGGEVERLWDASAVALSGPPDTYPR
jgi:hypothetical protein